MVISCVFSDFPFDCVRPAPFHPLGFLSGLDWQDERPPAPSYLRILYLGKILQDDDTLLRTCLDFFFLPTSPRLSVVDHGWLGFLGRRKVNKVKIDDHSWHVLLVPYADRRSTGVGFATSLPSASGASPAIVHLSIRPYALPSDDPALSKKKRLSVAVGRRLSTLSVGVGGGGRDVDDGETRRAGCCTGCTIC